MTDFETLPDIPEPAKNPLESNESGSVIFDDAPFPTPEESTEIQSENKQANQLAWIIAIAALLFLCLCCFGILVIILISSQGNNNYLYNFLNEVFAYTPLMTGL